MQTKKSSWFLWVLRIIAAVILLPTLFFKFSGAEESVYIFSKLGVEPWGRILSGVVELIAAILLLIPATTGIGALIASGVMAGAILSHLGKLGIVVMDDHGQLFIYALIVFIASIILLVVHKAQLLAYLKKAK